MGIFNQRKIKPATTPVTEQDLEEIKRINTIASGKLPFLEEATMSFEEYVDYQYDGKGDVSGRKTKFLFLLITTIKLYYINKFKIDNLPDTIDKTIMLSFLFVYGSVSIFKLGDEYLTLPYTVSKFDIYGRPTVIRPISPYNKGVQFREYTVDKDCVILRDNADGISSKTNSYGILYKIWVLLEDVAMQYNEIANDAILSRIKLAIGEDVDDATVENIQRAFLSGSFVIRFDLDSVNINQFLQGKGSKPNGTPISADSRQRDLTETFTFFMNQIKLHLLEKTDPNPQKKERKNVQETVKEDTFVDIANNSKLEIMKKALDKMNELWSTDITIQIHNEIETDLEQDSPVPEEEPVGDDNE